jgi:hypothetical protein
MRNLVRIAERKIWQETKSKNPVFAGSSGVEEEKILKKKGEADRCSTNFNVRFI